MRAAFFNFYLYMFISASLLTVALARDEIYELPLSNTLICFFLSLLGIVLNFFSITSEGEPLSSLMRHSRALTVLQILLILLGILLLCGSYTGFIGTIILAFPAICVWFLIEAAF